ncbi:hypothetical protein ACMD2_05949 [Ananas comosus]|uniref:Uncharacterized protein n=1 Tax=Ananas comosus TaxID=4615 RepID=A0A199UGA7_ANACO|nr:hypothetical protein ACMD2_05949 [Ananas comosus]
MSATVVVDAVGFGGNGVPKRRFDHQEWTVLEPRCIGDGKKYRMDRARGFICGPRSKRSRVRGRWG